MGLCNTPSAAVEVEAGIFAWGVMRAIKIVIHLKQIVFKNQKRQTIEAILITVPIIVDCISNGLDYLSLSIQIFKLWRKDSKDAKYAQITTIAC